MKKSLLLLAFAALVTCFSACEKDDPVSPTPSDPDTPDTPTAKVGRFSVAADQQVVFASGNVQYCPATQSWRFAPNQYDAVGDSNTTADENYSGWIDLFGFGTGNQPMLRSSNCDDYDVFADWGDNFEGDWRTLTEAEMNYLLLERPRHDSLCVPATVCGMEGTLLLPDDWDGPAVVPMYWNSHYDDNTYDAAAWETMELAGAIFLPAAGNVDGTLNLFRTQGCYWVASEPSASSSFSPSYCISETTAWRQSARRCLLRSVRLAKDAE